MEAHKILDGTNRARAHRRLQENESYEELLLLCRCDRGGRVPGVQTIELEEALEYVASSDTALVESSLALAVEDEVTSPVSCIRGRGNESR